MPRSIKSCSKAANEFISIQNHRNYNHGMILLCKRSTSLERATTVDMILVVLSVLSFSSYMPRIQLLHNVTLEKCKLEISSFHRQFYNYMWCILESPSTIKQQIHWCDFLCHSLSLLEK